MTAPTRLHSSGVRAVLLRVLASASVIFACTIITGCTTTPIPASKRPSTWAESIEAPGVPNMFRVSDTVYRGAQPTEEGLQTLARMGVRTVINLRQSDSDADLLDGLKLAYERIPISAVNICDDNVARFLRIATDPSRAPVFVHCHRGADRTGAMCAMYRVVVEGWSKDDAIAEMTGGGMEFHSLYGNLINYVRHADVARIRQQAGLQRTASPQ